MNISKKISYEDAGVNIDRANAFVDHIRTAASKTRRSGVLAGIGGFGALFEIPQERFKRPILVSGTDGVGTKLKLALALNRHNTIGIDLVAMCVNDIVCLGAEPLFFLDYFATGKLNSIQAEAIMNGIIQGCELAGAALIGGETAEMLGIYQGDDYDLAGFCVGAVEKENIIDGSNVQIGDLVIGLASSGPHSNGYSLIRKVLEQTGTSLHEPFEGTTLLAHLLKPTRIYVRSLLALMQLGILRGAAHITGGGLPDNLPRVYRDTLQAQINLQAWQWPAIFQWIQQKGHITQAEMLHTFNCGLGMVLFVAPSALELALKSLQEHGEAPVVIGQLQARAADASSVIFEGAEAL